MSNNPSLQNLKCSNCGGPMVSRKSSVDGSRFWGCRQFPKCRGTRDSMGMSKVDRDAERNKKEEDE